MIDKVKAHVVRHKTAYLTVGIAGITCFIMKGRPALALRGAGSESLALRGDLVIRPFVFLSKQTNNIFLTIKQELGRPPYLVHDTTDDLWYGSQSKVAKALGVSDSTVSQHLNGKRDHVAGHVLERVEL